MLYELGPLELFLERDFPTPGARGSIEAAAAPFVVALDAGAGAVERAGGQFAAVAVGVDDGGAALDLGDAATELARQSGEVSPELVSAAAGAGVLEGDLAGLASELLGDLEKGEPPQPVIPPGAPEDWGTDPSGGNPPGRFPTPPDYEPAPVPRSGQPCFGPECAQRYREALARQVLAWSGREATDDELLAVDRYMGTYGYLDDAALEWLWVNWVQPNL